MNPVSESNITKAGPTNKCRGGFWRKQRIKINIFESWQFNHWVPGSIYLEWLFLLLLKATWVESQRMSIYKIKFLVFQKQQDSIIPFLLSCHQNLCPWEINGSRMFLFTFFKLYTLSQHYISASAAVTAVTCHNSVWLHHISSIQCHFFHHSKQRKRKEQKKWRSGHVCSSVVTGR